MSVIHEFPFPFHKPAGQQLWRVLAGLFPVPLDAIAFAERFGIDPLDLPPNLTPRQLWRVILEKAAIAGTTPDLVQAALDQHKRNVSAGFLNALIDDRPVPVNPEPMEGFDPAVTQPEALLFTDDLTIPAGRVPRLIGTLGKLHALAPAVCLLRVENAFGAFFGTGFRVSSDLVLTNEHVLFPEKTKAAVVKADFGFDVDIAGTSLPVTSLDGDVSTIKANREDDWAVIRIANIPASIPTVALGAASDPKEGNHAYIIQHPEGRMKRLGFVRNLISGVTDDRIQYLTDTQSGSSGSPVFDEDAKIIGLHHRGGTPTQQTGKAPLTKNQGIRITRVVAGLKAQGLAV